MKTPYQFQETAIRQIREAPGFILADECGLGKTLTAIEAAPKDARVLVVCTGPLIPQWIDAVETQRPGTLCLVPGRIPYIFSSFDPPLWVFVTYYDLANSPFLSALSSVTWDYVVADEAHRLKNRQTGFARNIKKIPRIKSVGLTGTPIEKNPADLWSLLDFVTPGKFGTYWRFVKKNLLVSKDYFEHWIIGEAKDPEAFGALLSPYMTRRTKEQVAQDLPPKIFVPTKVEMGPKQARIYKAVHDSKDIIVDIGDQELLIKNALALLLRCQQIATWPGELDIQAPSAKFDWLSEFLKDYRQEGVVVFTKWRETAMAVQNAFGTAISLGAGYGDYDPLNPPDVLVGTIAHIGEGMNLQWANHAVFLDASWSTIQMAQAYDRIHRIDITQPKTLYMLTACMEDDLIYRALDHKWSVADIVFHYLHPD